jgi:hypothetical protein
MKRQPRTSRLVYRERTGNHYIVREFSDQSPAELVFESRNVHDVELILPQLQKAEGDTQPNQQELHRLMDAAPKIKMGEDLDRIERERKRANAFR